MRYRLTVEYDGRPFCGWQRQENGPTVQQALEDAARRFCGSSVAVYGSGRTDSGVHALGQVAHLDLPRAYEPRVVANALNAHLRDVPIAVLNATSVDDDFHARFSALERSYVYRILNRPAPPTFQSGRVWWVPKPLDAESMNREAGALIGQHDFSSFRAAECQAQSPIKTLDALQVWRRDDEILITARARSFLHHQVRNMVGSLMLVGWGKWQAGRMAEALNARDRAKAGPTAPADGLYFRAVRYGNEPALDDSLPVF